MGNCICVIDQKTTSLSGDDCGSFNKKRTKRRRSTVFHDDDGEKLLGETSNVTSSSSSPLCGSKREIKIKMTKKEFEDLMTNIDLKCLTTDEILSKLHLDGGDHIGESDDHLNHHQRPWRPALQSIPEID